MLRLALVALLLATTPSIAQSDQTAWQAEKCRLYETYWTEALTRFGSDDVNYAFIAANENFIASDCSDEGMACPRSNQELDIANALSLLMINEGAASTFLPFNCSADQVGSDDFAGPE